MKIIDFHTHVFNALERGKVLYETADQMGYDQINIMSAPPFGGLAQNISCACCKAMYPDRTYSFGGLEYYSGRGFLEQAERIVGMGFDGFKMIEGKPSIRKEIDIALDDPAYDGFYAYAEKKGLPILMHIADPRDFWDKALAPAWAVEAGWACDESHVPYRQFYTEAEHVLQKHPDLHVVFAHFCFLSDDRVNAQRMLDTYPNICFDITSGSEMYFEFNKDITFWRSFFIRYQDRIIFGTDSMDTVSETDVLTRYTINHMEKNFLEKDGINRAFDRDVAGLGLERKVLEKIYCRNAQRLISETPKRLNIQAVRDEMEVLLPVSVRCGLQEETEKLEALRAYFLQDQPFA